jgi:hypothetical protein
VENDASGNAIKLYQSRCCGELAAYPEQDGSSTELVAATGSTVPASKSLQQGLASSPRKSPGSPPASRALLSDARSFRGMFIKIDKGAKRYRERGIFCVAERVKSQQALKPVHDYCKAERVEP